MGRVSAALESFCICIIFLWAIFLSFRFVVLDAAVISHNLFLSDAIPSRRTHLADDLVTTSDQIRSFSYPNNVARELGRSLHATEKFFCWSEFVSAKNLNLKDASI